MISDVLVFTPVYRLEPETIGAIFAQEWEGPLSFLLQRDNPTGGGRADLLHQYIRGRETFLRGPYDAMWVVESDIIPPPGTLKKLAELDVDCAYGVYQFRASAVINLFERYPGTPRNEGESLSLHPKKLIELVRAGKGLITGGGMGCLLIKRHVLEAIDFRLDRGGGHPDTYFNRDVLRAGFVQMADCSVACGHKDTDGTILYPDLPDGARR